MLLLFAVYFSFNIKGGLHPLYPGVAHSAGAETALGSLEFPPGNTDVSASPRHS